MTLALAAIVAAGIASPHLLRLHRVPPVTAAALWLSSLALRAFAGVLASVYLLFFLPRTELFAALTHWCLHLVLPLSAAELEVEGHGIGDAAVYVPGALLTVSLVTACLTTARAAWAARHLTHQDVLGHGPGASLIVSGADVAFAVAGVARPRIVVSAGALVRLDDDELAAALEHERAHIARGHRFVMLLALAFRAVGRLVPGGGHALRELAFQLERDADRAALRRRNDRLALASVICKAAGADEPGNGVTAALGTAEVSERVGELLTGEQPPRHPRAAAALNGLAVTMVACTLALAAMVPGAAVAATRGDTHAGHHGQHCDH